MKTQLDKQQSQHLIKRCNKCGRDLLINLFHKSKSGKYGVMAVCKDCKSKKKLSIIPDLQDEIWLPIVGYEGLYEISNRGRVKSFYKGEKYAALLKAHYDIHGYLKVCLTKDKIPKDKFVHKLIAEAFIPNPDNKPYIDHINTDRHDNRVENLRWCTHKENINNKKTIEKFIERGKDKQYIDNQIAKQPKTTAVDMLTLSGVYECSFRSINEAARYVNGSPGGIRECCLGIRPTSYSHKWRFSNK